MSQTPTVVVQNSQPSQGSSLATSAAVSGMAAMGGAMAGSAISAGMYNSNNGYHGIPYGTPCYNEAGHAYYHGTNGERMPVPMDPGNPYLNQWGRQTAYQNNSENRRNDYNNLNPNQQQALKNAGAEDYNNREQMREDGAGRLGEDEGRLGRRFRR